MVGEFARQPATRRAKLNANDRAEVHVCAFDERRAAVLRKVR